MMDSITLLQMGQSIVEELRRPANTHHTGALPLVMLHTQVFSSAFGLLYTRVHDFMRILVATPRDQSPLLCPNAH